MGNCLQNQQTDFKSLPNIDESEDNSTTNIKNMVNTLLFGYIRTILINVNQSHIIPLDIISLCTDYYGSKWTNSIYQISIDRYGFPLEIKNKRQPNSISTNDQTNRIKLRTEQQILHKYMQLLYGKNITTSNKNISHNIINNQKLKSLIRNHGIPQHLRSTLWPILLNIENTKQSTETGNIYNSLISNSSHPYPQVTLKSISRMYRKHSRFGMTGLEQQLNYDPNSLYKIKIQNCSTNNLHLCNYDKDRDPIELEREKIEHFFSNCTDTQKQIWNITKAFHLYKPELGVLCCGGLFQIAPFLLMFMTEENVFWCLITLFENSDKYLWIPEQTQWKLYFYCMERMVAKYLSKISNHFIANGIHSASMYQTLQWFATIFICCKIGSNFDVLTRIWDLYLLDGGIVIYKAGLGLLKYYEDDILSTNGFEELMELLQNYGDMKQFNVDRYFKILKSWKFTDLKKIVDDYNRLNSVR